MRAAIYCRVSTEKQGEEGASLETQEAACKRYCADEGWEIAGLYSEQYTGSKRERPELSKLRVAVRSREVNVVVVYAVDRLSRNQTDTTILVDEMERNKVALACVSEPFEATTVGKMVLSVRAFAAELEREKIVERTQRGKRARVQQGKIHRHGPELYGYRRDKEAGVRIVYEPEAAVVRQIFRWVATEHVPLRTVAARLNTEGTPSPAVGKLHYNDPQRIPRWGKPQIARMLSNPAYKGETIAWRWQNNKHHNSTLRSQEEWIPLPDGVTPPIVPSTLWQAAQDILENNRAADATRNESRPYLLRSHVHCAVCGRRMRAEPEHGRRIYRCSSRHTPTGTCGASRVPADEVEAWSWDLVENLLRNPDVIAAEIKRQQKQAPNANLLADRIAVQKALDKVTHQQEKWVRRFTEGADHSFPWELVEREIIRLDAEKKNLQANLADLDKIIKERQTAIIRLDAIAAYCQRVAVNLSALGFDEKRLALEALSIKVIANGREWQIQGTIPIENAGVSSPTSL